MKFLAVAIMLLTLNGATIPTSAEETDKVTLRRTVLKVGVYDTAMYGGGSTATRMVEVKYQYDSAKSMERSLTLPIDRIIIQKDVGDGAEYLEVNAYECKIQQCTVLNMLDRDWLKIHPTTEVILHMSSSNVSLDP